MKIDRIKLNSSSYYLMLILLTFGIKSPEWLNLSSFSVLVMVIALVHLTLNRLIQPIKVARKYLLYNLTLLLFTIFYTMIALLKGKLYYPIYPLNIIFFQVVFFVILQKTTIQQIVKVFVAVGLINVIFYGIQIIGGLFDLEPLLRLSFVGANKSQIERYGILPRA